MEEKNKDDINELDFSDILEDLSYEDRSLNLWIEELTITIPPLPCSSQTITQLIIDLNNKYQTAYNCLSKLTVLSNAAEKKFKAERDKAVSKKLEEYTSKNITRTPAAEKLELIVVNSDKKLKNLYELYQLYSSISDFFASHKNKLEKTFSLIEKISYHISASDKAFSKARHNEGL